MVRLNTAALEIAALELVDLTKSDQGLYDFQRRIDRAIEAEDGLNEKITLSDAQNNRVSNLYALLSIFDSAKHEIIIYTRSLESGLYSRDDIISYIQDWLNEDSNRILTILLKEAPDTETDYFFNIYGFLDNASQLNVRITKEREVKDCNINGIIADGRIYKLKEVDADGVENIVLNYNDPEVVGRLDETYKTLISNEHSTRLEYKPRERYASLLKNIFSQSSPKTEYSQNDEAVVSAVSSLQSEVKSLLRAA